MAAPKAPDPDEPGGLSAREQKILAAIEDDMLTADPALARDLTGAHRPRPELTAIAGEPLCGLHIGGSRASRCGHSARHRQRLVRR